MSMYSDQSTESIPVLENLTDSADKSERNLPKQRSSPDRQVIVIAVSDSEHSEYTVKWAMENYIPNADTKNLKVVLLHVLINEMPLG
jgi:hypothetical protein